LCFLRSFDSNESHASFEGLPSGGAQDGIYKHIGCLHHFAVCIRAPLPSVFLVIPNRSSPRYQNINQATMQISALFTALLATASITAYGQAVDMAYVTAVITALK
jgi:hypothetical protein